jgi:HAD superfamily hydrolase (TIGR01484 family)
MRPIDQLPAGEAARLRFVLMDIDDTLTTGGKLGAPAYTALWRLRQGGLAVIPVTGRPAGWCDLIAREWPVDGVVGENGALAFWERPGEGGRRVLEGDYHPQAIKNDHPVLKKVTARALAEVPGLRLAKDQFARLFDAALDFAEEAPVLPLSAAERVRDIALAEGARAKISSIHVNVWMGDYDKLSMIERFLTLRFGWTGDTGEVLFVGDSPNDESAFGHFPLSCGVANVLRYGDLIKRLPAFRAERECGEGFAELAEAVLNKRGSLSVSPKYPKKPETRSAVS